MSNEIKSIQVLGSGCPTCKKLLEITKKVVGELNINIEVEYITDVAKMIEMGVMQSPVLAINGQPVLTGGGKSEDDVRLALQGGLDAEDVATSTCSCGGKC
jgi:small redox-active disulfide protein 2